MIELIERHKRKLLVATAGFALIFAIELVLSRQGIFMSGAISPSELGLALIAPVAFFVLVLPLIYLAWFRRSQSGVLLVVRQAVFWLFALLIAYACVRAYTLWVFG